MSRRLTENNLYELDVITIKQKDKTDKNGTKIKGLAIKTGHLNVKKLQTISNDGVIPTLSGNQQHCHS